MKFQSLLLLLFGFLGTHDPFLLSYTFVQSKIYECSTLKKFCSVLILLLVYNQGGRNEHLSIITPSTILLRIDDKIFTDFARKLIATW